MYDTQSRHMREDARENKRSGVSGLKQSSSLGLQEQQVVLETINSNTLSQVTHKYSHGFEMSAPRQHRRHCHGKTCMQEVDDWMWYEDHGVFKKQACMQSAWVNKSSSQVKEWPKYVRLACLFLLSGNALYILVNPGLFPKDTFE